MSNVNIRSVVRRIDHVITKKLGERDALIILLFHSVFLDGDEANSNTVVPNLGLRLDDFRQLMEHYHKNGYKFVSPSEMLNDLPRGKYCLLTFDDGYYNNRRILPILESFNAPALFFVSSQHVIHNRSFWWDVVHRIGSQEGKSQTEIEDETNGFKSMRHDEIAAELSRRYGDESHKPIGDLDRPFTPRELAEFASHELVHLGNHTSDHAILTNYDSRGVRQQIRKGQDDIAQMTGVVPRIISYPNGNFSDEICHIAREEGLQMGITTLSQKNSLPLDRRGLKSMKLSRFMAKPFSSIEEQCLGHRSDLGLVYRLYNFKQRLRKAYS